MNSGRSSKPIHPAWLRVIHWVNFYVLLVMFWSGLLIYWAYPTYKIAWGDRLYPILPPAFFKLLGLESQLGKGLAYHFNFMWILMISGICYVVFSVFSGNWRHLFPSLRDGKRLWHMFLVFLKQRKEEPQTTKYNPAQKLAYFTAVLALILLVFSGWAIYKPARLSWLTQLLGGYRSARWIHFLCTGYVFLFFVVHVVQVIRAGWANFSAMVTGGNATHPVPPSHEN